MRVFADASLLPRCSIRLTPLVALVLLVILMSGALAEEPPKGHSFITFTNWSASALGEHADGSVCWIIDDDGSLRVELLRSPDLKTGFSGETRTDVATYLEPLLTWSGNGWTLVLGPDGKGTLNGWGEEWRKVPAGLAQMVRLVTTSLQHYPDRPGEFPFASIVGPSRPTGIISRPKILGSQFGATPERDVWRFQLAPLTLREPEGGGTDGFRRKMTARGRGTGGVDEILVLSWHEPAGQDGYGLQISSSRRPGSLNLEPSRNLAVTKPDPEVYLPLWPLSQFIETR